MITALKNKVFGEPEMVSYWKKNDFVEAKVYESPEGHYEMKMQGEKYPFPGHPRGILLYGKLSPLKHIIKNAIFNALWALLENKASKHEIDAQLTKAWDEIFTLAEQTRYDFVPYEKLNPPVKELWRAMTAIGVDTRLKETICFILQEDDAYRMRFQWLVKFFPRFRKPTIEDFEYALSMAEHAEVVGDMKERQRLFKRIFMYLVQDSELFQRFLKEVNWKKIGLTKADKYFFRAKYFKVDYPEREY